MLRTNNVVSDDCDGINLILAGLFELQLTRSAFDGDRDGARIPFARISHDDILP
jgi:hypothetical protein